MTQLSQPSQVTGRTRWLALVFLLLLAACLAEFLTGSTPVTAVFRNPVGFAANVALYGCGSILIREVAIRWRKRWGTILLLGGAYAVGEEGFAAKTMTDPVGSPVGNQLYNHFAGINWVPLSFLTLFHSAFSIAVPLVMLELLFPETKGRPLVGNLGLGIVTFAYGLTVTVLSQWLGNPYVPPVFTTIFLSAYALAFILAAYFVPSSFLRAKKELRDRGEVSFYFLGVGFMGVFFLNFLFGHLLPWPLQAFLFVLLPVLTARYLVNHAGKNGNDIAKICFILGMLSIFILPDISLELGGDVGVIVFTALMLIFALLLRRQILRRNRQAAEGMNKQQVLS